MSTESHQEEGLCTLQLQGDPEKNILTSQGRIQGFPKGGSETRDTKCGGAGLLSALDPTRKAGGGGGGGGGMLSASGPIQTAGVGGGLLST